MSENGFAKYILYADDDADDQETIKELLAEVIPGVQLITKDSGEELLQFLNGLQGNSNWPVLIVLDLNMPAWDGIQTLSIIKQNERYKHLPVLIFSTTDNENDKERAIAEGAVAFIRKPSRYSALKTIIETFAVHFRTVQA